jgi:hypothetical protein
METYHIGIELLELCRLIIATSESKVGHFWDESELFGDGTW